MTINTCAPDRRRSVLRREDVLATALRIIDADGVEALSMRRMGKALDRDPMRLYRFASSKDELLDGVVELVLGELRVPAAEAGRWEEMLRRTAHASREIALAHPHVVPLLVTRPLATPLAMRPLGTLRPLEGLLELLVGAGFDERGALHAYRLYMGFLQGHVLNELQERVYDPEETDDVLRLGLHRLPAKEFPRLRSLAPEEWLQQPPLRVPGCRDRWSSNAWSLPQATSASPASNSGSAHCAPVS